MPLSRPQLTTLSSKALVCSLVHDAHVHNIDSLNNSSVNKILFKQECVLVSKLVPVNVGPHLGGAYCCERIDTGFQRRMKMQDIWGECAIANNLHFPILYTEI